MTRLEWNGNRVMLSTRREGCLWETVATLSLQEARELQEQLREFLEGLPT